MEESIIGWIAYIVGSIFGLIAIGFVICFPIYVVVKKVRKWRQKKKQKEREKMGIK